MLSLALVTRRAPVQLDTNEEPSYPYKAGAVTQRIRSTSTMDEV